MYVGINKLKDDYSARIVINYLREVGEVEITQEEIASAIQMPLSTVRRSIWRSIKRGDVQKLSKYVYRVLRYV